MITKEEVANIASLAKLRFDEQEMEHFVPTFQEILGYFEKLQKVSTEAAEPTCHAQHSSGSDTRLRPDTCGESIDRQTVLRNAPDVAEGHFRVPRVIE